MSRRGKGESNPPGYTRYKILIKIVDSESLRSNDLKDWLKNNLNISQNTKHLEILKNQGYVSIKDDPGKPYIIKPNISNLHRAIHDFVVFSKYDKEVLVHLQNNNSFLESLADDIKSYAHKDFLVELMSTNPYFLNWILKNWKELTEEHQFSWIVGESEKVFTDKLSLDLLASERKGLLDGGTLPESSLVVVWYSTLEFGENGFGVSKKLKEKVENIIRLGRDGKELELEYWTKSYILEMIYGKDFEEVLRFEIRRLINNIKSIGPIKSFDDLWRILKAKNLIFGMVNGVLDSFAHRKSKGEETELKTLFVENKQSFNDVILSLS